MRRGFLCPSSFEWNEMDWRREQDGFFGYVECTIMAENWERQSNGVMEKEGSIDGLKILIKIYWVDL